VKRQKWTDSTSGKKKKKVKAQKVEGSAMRLGKRERNLKVWKQKKTQKREKETNIKNNNQLACGKTEITFINAHQKQSLGDKFEKANAREETCMNLDTKVDS